MQYYSRPMVDFVALKFGILIAKRLFNGNRISSILAFMPVPNKIGQKVKKCNLRFFGRKIQRMFNKSAKNLYSKSF